jgi:hypothetical protein
MGPLIQQYADQMRLNLCRMVLSRRLQHRPQRDMLRRYNILPTSWIFPTMISLQRQLTNSFRRDSLSQWLRHRQHHPHDVFSYEDRIRIEHFLDRHMIERPSVLDLEHHGFLSNPTHIAQIVCPSIASRIRYFEALAH